MSDEGIQEQELSAKAMNTASVSINLNGNRLVRNVLIFGIAFEVFLVIIDAFVNYGGLTNIEQIRNLCNIAREGSLASWFGTTQTLMTGLTLWLIFLINKHSLRPKKTIIGWCVLAVFFTYMAVDDGAELHERLSSAFYSMFTSSSSQEASASWLASFFENFPSYTWQLVFGPLFAAMGIFTLIFLWHELKHRREIVLIILALSCFVAAVGLDFFEGLEEYQDEWDIYPWFINHFDVERYTVRHFSKSVEEFLEMVGNTLFWAAFLSHLAYLGKKGLSIFFIRAPKQ